MWHLFGVSPIKNYADERPRVVMQMSVSVGLKDAVQVNGIRKSAGVVFVGLVVLTPPKRKDIIAS
jgi:hypothetical protein